MKGFVVSVRSERGSATYSRDTLEEALSVAKSLADQGKVTIIDPVNREYSSGQFQELKDRWSAPE